MTLEERVESLENKLASYTNGWLTIKDGQIFIADSSGAKLSRMQYITGDAPEKAAHNQAASYFISLGVNRG
jgi:hypothetical protein